MSSSVEPIAEVVDEVDPLRSLPRETERDAARILRAGLHAVERDLDHLLGADRHHPLVTVDGELQEAFGLPPQRLVGHPLERLAQHHEPSGDWIPGAEVEVAEPAMPAPVTPLRRQDYQIERVRRLDLEPAASPPAGLVSSLQRLDHDAFVAMVEGCAEELLSV